MRYPPALPLLLLIMLCNFQFTRAFETPIVISANEHTTVALFFPAKIKKVIEPAANFKVSYIQNDLTATLNAREGKPSNLTVITQDNRIYSFELKYAVKIETFTWVVQKEHAIGQISSPTNTVIRDHEEETASLELKAFQKEKRTDQGVQEGDLYELERESYYEIFCQNNYLQEPILASSSANSSRIKLQLNNIQKDRNETYFNITVQNDSEIPYVLQRVLFFIKTKGEESHMKLKPLFVFNAKEAIASGTSNTQMHVYKDFVLGEQQQLYIMVEEVGSSRVVVLPIDKEMDLLH